MINRLLSFFLCALLMFSSCANQDSKSIALDELKQFYNCSTVDWAKLDTLYYRPYNCDWPDEIGARIHPDFPPEYAATAIICACISVGNSGYGPVHI